MSNLKDRLLLMIYDYERLTSNLPKYIYLGVEDFMQLMAEGHYLVRVDYHTGEITFDNIEVVEVRKEHHISISAESQK